MKPLDATTLDALRQDFDAREALLREIVADRLAASPPPAIEDHVTATYFFAFRTQTLKEAVAEISYHATNGTKHAPPGSLLEACSARAAGIDAFDSSGRIGLLHIGFPLKMMLQPDGHLTSVDLLHTIAGAIIFDVYENLDARLISMLIPDRILKTFPGPAHGPKGLRRMTGFDKGQIAFGTILKPTAGITPQEVGNLVEDAAASKLFLFIKEDENLYPRLDYSPVRERARLAAEAIRRVQDRRGGLGIIFAPHISGAPHEILESAHAALEEGARGLMFSETFAGGAVRMVREATRKLEAPPAIYGHNAGIGVKTRCIWREVIDLLARLDGIDFRQTAPVRPGATPFIRPYGREWFASEEILTRPLPGIHPTMIARAGALDQGNIGINLADAEERGIGENILFLAGSAINSIHDAQGKADPRIGTEAMLQAIDAFRSGGLRGVHPREHLKALVALAERKNLKALREALRQRYPASPEAQ